MQYGLKNLQTTAKAKEGKSEIETFFTTLFRTMQTECVDISEVSQHWNATSWKIGYDVVFSSATFTPNSAACMKLMMLGEMELMLVDVISLQKAVSALGQKPAEGSCNGAENSAKGQKVTLNCCESSKELEAFVKEATNEVIAELIPHGLQVWKGKLLPSSLIYIPAGWFVVEKSEKGPVIYGIRKSVFFQKSFNNFGCIRACNEVACCRGQ